MGFFSALKDKFLDQFGVLDDAEDYEEKIRSIKIKMSAKVKAAERLMIDLQDHIDMATTERDFEAGEYRQAKSILVDLLKEMRDLDRDVANIIRKGRRGECGGIRRKDGSGKGVGNVGTPDQPTSEEKGVWRQVRGRVLEYAKQQDTVIDETAKAIKDIAKAERDHKNAIRELAQERKEHSNPVKTRDKVGKVIATVITALASVALALIALGGGR